MKTKNESMVLRDYVSELLEITKVTARRVAGRNHETVGHSDIIQYAKSVKEIHDTLMKSYDPTEGRSKVIDRFLSQWNNLVLGAFYLSDIAIEEKALSKRQYDIFANTLEEIIEYGKIHLSG